MQIKKKKPKYRIKLIPDWVKATTSMCKVQVGSGPIRELRGFPFWDAVPTSEYMDQGQTMLNMAAVPLMHWVRSRNVPG